MNPRSTTQNFSLMRSCTSLFAAALGAALCVALAASSPARAGTVYRGDISTRVGLAVSNWKCTRGDGAGCSHKDLANPYYRHPTLQ